MVIADSPKAGAPPISPGLGLVAALVSIPAFRADFNYRVEITGAEDRELGDLLDSVSELKTLQDKPPASAEALGAAALSAISAGSRMPLTPRLMGAEFSYGGRSTRKTGVVTSRSA